MKRLMKLRILMLTPIESEASDLSQLHYHSLIFFISSTKSTKFGACA